ncbi:hypothetical protein [Niastella sp. OAS944]|uniref:hypothetical protein n=1 Tax=Niastella sp. OAS944 TaxID=2664089 RepID=UPI00346B6EFB|nr:hypothetical protein [Chitinophagaceae bacterium OAS944]
MKRVKIMLLSLLVLAVAGGAMAFNAKRTTKFCTIATLSNGSCPTSPSSCALYTGQTNAGGTGDVVCYTTQLSAQNNCSGITSCTTKTTLTTD